MNKNIERKKNEKTNASYWFLKKTRCLPSARGQYMIHRLHRFPGCTITYRAAFVVPVITAPIALAVMNDVTFMSFTHTLVLSLSLINFSYPFSLNPNIF